MRVSVVMSAYNAEAYIAEAIESVLCQSRTVDQFIIVDDGSIDGTRREIARYGNRITCLLQDNQGPTAAINRAIASATGDLLGFIDADDIWSERKLERQLAVLEADAGIDAVFGLVRQFVSPEVPEDRKAALSPPNEIVRGETKLAMLIRRSAYDRLGGFDDSIRAASLIEWLGRAKLSGVQSVSLDEVVALRRLHLANGGRVNTKHQDKETLLALKRVIDARRSSQ